MIRSPYRRVFRADDAPRAVQRVDRYELRLDRSTIRHPPNMPGVVDVWGVATRVGVFEYDDDERPGDVIREWRPPDEVLDSASLSTLVGVPFTVDHPTEPVTSATWRDLAQGHVLEIKVEGRLVLARIRIGSDDAKAAIERGTVELSCGYSAFLEERRGVTPDGEVYDAIQRDIRYNHLALVDLARAGHVARLHLDKSGARVQRIDQAARHSGPRPMKIQYDGKTYTIPELLVPGMLAKADSTAKAVRRGDKIEVGSVKFTDPDGGGEVELVLPMGSIEQMLAMVGASSTPEPAATEPPPTDADVPGEDPLEQDADPPRMDAAAIEDVVRSAVERVVPQVIQAREDRARERSELERRCAPHLPSGYVFDKADDLDLVLDTIEAVAPAENDDARNLADKARKGDERARGRLDAKLDGVLGGDRDDRDDTGRALGKVFDLRRRQADSDDKAAPRMSRAARARADRIAKMTDNGRSAG